MGLGRPTYCLKIPSLYDGLELDCRVYHPPDSDGRGSNRPLNAAIIAHPYAPLGGCYDDPIVGVVGGCLLRTGYIVGTINLRGAFGSQGTTSWTGRPELADYISFYSFMLCYMAAARRLDNETRRSSLNTPHALDTNDLPSTAESNDHSARFICAGYSYGSVMARYAPVSDSMIDMLSKTTRGSVQEEIYLRASHLARLHLSDQERQTRRDSANVPGSSHPTPTAAIGGKESNSPSPAAAAAPRSGHLVHEVERLRHSIDRFRDRHHHHEAPTIETGPKDEHNSELSETLQTLPRLLTSYLLISPPLTLSLFLTALFPLSLESKISSFDHLSIDKKETPSDRLVNNQSFAIWGQADFLQPSRSLRKWAKPLNEKAGSEFTYREIKGAGHFWREDGVVRELREGVEEWVRGLG